MGGSPEEREVHGEPRAAAGDQFHTAAAQVQAGSYSDAGDIAEVEAVIDEPSSSLAWRILTSPRTIGVIAFVIATVLGVAAFIPQGALPGELARHMSFSTAEAVRDLGLEDVLTSWPLLLMLLLGALASTGLWLTTRLARARAFTHLFATTATTEVPSGLDAVKASLPAAMGGRLTVTDAGTRLVATRGLWAEGLGVALVGFVTLLAALAISRSAGLEARLTLEPGGGALSESKVRDGDLMLLRQLPFGLMCKRPDPQDPSRSFPCKASLGGASPADVDLVPGAKTHVGPYSLRPLAEELRQPRDTDAVDLVVRRGGAMERLRVEPGATVQLTRGGERLTPIMGPDGPLVVLAPQGGRARLLVPGPPGPPDDALSLEVEHATTLEIAASTSPELPLVLAGFALLVLGLLLALAVPHVRVELTSAQSTRIVVTSLNRRRLPASVLAALGGHEPPSSPALRPVAAWFATLRTVSSRAGLALVLAAGGLGVGLGASWGTVAIPFAVAALVALDSRAAPWLGLLALIAGLGTAPTNAHTPWLHFMAMAAAGFTLGLLGRWLFEERISASARGPLVLAAILALLLGLLGLVPSPSVALATSEGGPLVGLLTLADGGSAMRASWPVPLHMPGDAFAVAPMWLLLLGLPIAFSLLFAHLRGLAAPGSQRPAWLAAMPWVGLTLAVVASLLGLAGLIQLTTSSGTLSPDEVEQLRRSLDLASPDAAVLSLTSSSWELRTWSRPFVDGLVLIIGLGLAATLWPLTRPHPLAATPPRAPATTSLLLAASIAAIAAVALSAYALGFAGPTLLALGACALIATPLVVARDLSATVLVRLSLMGALAVLVAMWLLPVLFVA